MKTWPTDTFWDFSHLEDDLIMKLCYSSKMPHLSLYSKYFQFLQTFYLKTKFPSSCWLFFNFKGLYSKQTCSKLNPFQTKTTAEATLSDDSEAQVIEKSTLMKPAEFNSLLLSFHVCFPFFLCLISLSIPIFSVNMKDRSRIRSELATPWYLLRKFVSQGKVISSQKFCPSTKVISSNIPWFT